MESTIAVTAISTDRPISVQIDDLKRLIVSQTQLVDLLHDSVHNPRVLEEQISLKSDQVSELRREIDRLRQILQSAGTHVAEYHELVRFKEQLELLENTPAAQAIQLFKKLKLQIKIAESKKGGGKNAKA